MRAVVVSLIVVAACGDNVVPPIQNPARGAYQEWVEIPIHGIS